MGVESMPVALPSVSVVTVVIPPFTTDMAVVEPVSFIIWIVLEARYNPPKGFCILPKLDVNPCVGTTSPVREIPPLACINPLKEASPVNSGESFVAFNVSNKLEEVSNFSKCVF